MKSLLWTSIFTATAAFALSAASNAVTSLSDAEANVVAPASTGVVELVAYGHRGWRADSQHNGRGNDERGLGYKRFLGGDYYDYNSGPGLYLNFDGSRRYGDIRRGHHDVGEVSSSSR